jgi:hypothetical protein
MRSFWSGALFTRRVEDAARQSRCGLHRTEINEKPPTKSSAPGYYLPPLHGQEFQK